MTTRQQQRKYKWTWPHQRTLGYDQETKPNSHGVEQRAETQTNIREKLLKEIIEENFPNLGKDMDIQIQEADKTTNRHDQKITSLHYSQNSQNYRTKKEYQKL
jgi:hypothetical protein